MTPSFISEARVLAVGKLPPPAHTRKGLILWPVWLHTVAAGPTSSREGLDPFARAVWEIQKCGEDRPNVIADLLDLRVEMVRLLQSRLRERQPDLQQAAEAPRAMDILYVLRDARSGKLLNRLLDHRGERQAERDERRGIFKLRMGNIATADTSDVMYIPPSETVPEHPDETELRDAVEQFSDLFRHRESGLPELLRRNRQLRLEPLLDSAPYPFFLPIALHQSSDSNLAWDVWDPFSGDKSPSLRELVADACEQVPRLRALRDEIASASRVQLIHDEPAELAWMELAHRCSELQAQEPTTEAQRLAQSAVRGMATGRVRGGGQAERAAAEYSLIDCGRALESALEVATARWPSGSAGAEWLARSGPHRATEMTNFLLQLCTGPGSLACDAPMPAGWRALGMNDVRRAMRPGSTAGIHARLYANVVAAMLYREHGLRTVLRAQPRWLRDCERLARLRNKSAHGGSSLSSADIREAEQLVLDVLPAVLDLEYLARPTEGESNG